MGIPPSKPDFSKFQDYVPQRGRARRGEFFITRYPAGKGGRKHPQWSFSIPKEYMEQMRWQIGDLVVPQMSVDEPGWVLVKRVAPGQDGFSLSSHRGTNSKDPKKKHRSARFGITVKDKELDALFFPPHVKILTGLVEVVQEGLAVYCGEK